MLRLTFLLFLTAITACAEPLITPFKQPESFPLTFRLRLPKHAAVISHEQTNHADTITAHMSDDRDGGMIVEAVDSAGKQVWRRDFGYNLSAAPGCSVSISFHPHLNALIVSFEGYKWDHTHALLFVEKTTSACTIREYPETAPEIAAFLQKQPGYNDSYKYWIYPAKFAGHQVVFCGIPLEQPERQNPHPLAQEVRWFDITASIDKDFKIAAIEAKPSHH